MAGFDVFKADGLNMLSLTAAVNEFVYIPNRVQRLGLFEERGVNTTVVAVEKIRNTFALVPTTPRGAPGVPNTKDLRNLRNFTVPHYNQPDAIQADEVQNIRAFGSESELDSVQNEVNRRMRRMRANIEGTIEYQRISAIQGNLLDSDGTVLYNYFTEFQVGQDTVAFGSFASGAVLNFCTDIAKLIEDELGATGYDHLHAFCGYDWWKQFITCSDVKTAYQNWMAVQRSQADPLTMDLRYKGFEFGGITWEVYRGKAPQQGTTPGIVGANVDFVNAAQAYVFPVGVPEMFQTVYAPADYIETVNTNGLPFYAKQAPDPSGFNRFQQLEVQSNPLSLCTRPKATIKCTKT
jgi:hypothetical protein